MNARDGGVRLVVLALVAGCSGEPTPPTGGPPGGEVDADADGALADVDCDDGNPARFPGADEVCDGVDNDCDLEVDDDPIDGIPGYEDADGDGYGADPPVIVACERSPSLVDRGGDCDDTRADFHPGAPEGCDGLDGDCDPTTSEDGTVSIATVRYDGLQAALDAAVDGDTVDICEATWFGPFVVPPITVTLAARGSPEATILQGDGRGPVLVASDATVTLRGLTVTGGRPNGATSMGGGLSALRSTVTVEDCVFRDNSHRNGGGIGVDIGALTVTGSTFTGNSATGIPYYSVGGALAAGAATLVIRDTTFTGNVSEAGGGAVSAYAGDSAELVRVTFTDNEAMGGGGADLSTDTATISESTFTGNVATGYGGALTVSRTTSITDTTFEANEALIGGGIQQYTGDLTLERVEFLRNAADEAGGAMTIFDFATTTATDCVFQENTAAEGGGLDMSNSDSSRFDSFTSDWGVAATDNQVADVSFGFGRQWWFTTEDFSCVSYRSCE